MKYIKCGLAREANINDEKWQRHASNCIECSEVLKVGQWMNSLSAATAVPTLPTVGFLMVKARIRQKQSAARNAARPLNVMAAFAGTILTLSVVLLFVNKTRVSSAMLGALGMIAWFGGILLAGTVIAAAVCAATAYIMRETGSAETRSRL